MSKLQWKQAYERKLRSEMWQHSRAETLIAEGKASSEELTALLEHDPEKFKKLTFLMRPYYYTNDTLEVFKEHREFIHQGILPFKALPMIAKSDPEAITALARSVSSHHTKAILLKEGAPLHEARHVPVKGVLLSTKVAELATNHPREFKNLFFRFPPYRAAEFLLHDRASFQELSDLYDEDQAIFEALTYAGSILVDDDAFNRLPLCFAERRELARISIEGFKRGAAEYRYINSVGGRGYFGTDHTRMPVFLSPGFVTLYKNDPEAIEALLAGRPKKILISEHSLVSLQEMYAFYKKDPDVFKALMGSDLAFDLLQRGQADLQTIHALYCKDPANFEKNCHNPKLLKLMAKQKNTLKQWNKKYPACQARDLITQGIVSFEELKTLKAKNPKKFKNLVTLSEFSLLEFYHAANFLLTGRVGFQELSDLYDQDRAMFRALTYRHLSNSGLYGVVLNGMVTWEQLRALADISVAGLWAASRILKDRRYASVFLNTEFVTLYKNDREAAKALTRELPGDILTSTYSKTSLQEMYALYKNDREAFNALIKPGAAEILQYGKASVETMRAVYHHDPKNFRENCSDHKLWKAIAAEQATRVATVHSAPKVSANESVGRFTERAAEIKAAELSKHTAPVLKVPTKEPVERLVAPQVVKSEPKPAPTPTEARVKKSAGRFTARAEEVQAQLRQWEQKYPKCQASELIAKDPASFDALAKLEATDPEKFKNLVLTSDPYRAAELLLKQKVSFQELSDLYDQDRAMFEKLTHKGNGNLYVLVRGDVIGWKQLTELADISLKGLKRGAEAWYRAYSASGGDKGTKAASVFLSAEFVTLYKNDPKAIKAVVKLCPTDILLNGEASLKVMHALYRKDPANFAENCSKPETWEASSVEKGKHPAPTKRSAPKEPVGRFTEMAAEKRTVKTLEIPSANR